MIRMFDKDLANFNSMFANYNDLIPLHVKDVMQKALIQVDEKGTEAAAMTRNLFLTI